MLQNIIDSLDYTIKSCEALFNKEQVIQDNYNAYIHDKEVQEQYLDFIKGAKNKYMVVVNELYEESIAALKDTLNSALKYIMYDKKYSADLVLEDLKGMKMLSILLVDDLTGLEVDLKDGVGNGIRTILSFILKAYYLLNQNSKVLFLDEKYSALSSHYVPRFFDFMHTFCEENDFIIVMISHTDAQIEFADKIYYLNDGVIQQNTKTEALMKQIAENVDNVN